MKWNYSHAVRGGIGSEKIMISMKQWEMEWEMKYCRMQRSNVSEILLWALSATPACTRDTDITTTFVVQFLALDTLNHIQPRINWRPAFAKDFFLYYLSDSWAWANTSLFLSRKLFQLLIFQRKYEMLTHFCDIPVAVRWIDAIC